MESRYPATLHVTEEISRKIDQAVDAAVISSRPGGGNTTQSYLKGDIIADQLNQVFGPLGWMVEANIHQMDDWSETKTVMRNNVRTEIGMHMVQVVANVKLTIKKITPEGTDSVYVTPGIGYGEVEQGKSRKEAFGMAVKGAATDGLKRCASLLGKAFGMMMASNGSQDELEYAHNGKPQNLSKARNMRRSAAPQRDERPRRDEQRRDAPRDDDRQRDDRGQRDERPRDERPRDERPRDERPRDERPRDEQRRAPAQDADRGQDRGGERQERQPEQRQASPEPRDEAPAKPRGKGRQVDTNYNLDSVPITKDEMTDFGATLIERVKEMRQHSDRVGLVKQHLNTIKNLDPTIRKRVIDRLRDLEVDVDKIPS